QQTANSVLTVCVSQGDNPSSREQYLLGEHVSGDEQSEGTLVQLQEDVGLAPHRVDRQMNVPSCKSRAPPLLDDFPMSLAQRWREVVLGWRGSCRRTSSKVLRLPDQPARAKTRSQPDSHPRNAGRPVSWQAMYPVRVPSRSLGRRPSARTRRLTSSAADQASGHVRQSPSPSPPASCRSQVAPSVSRFSFSFDTVGRTR